MVAHDIASAGRVGAGDVEFVPFYEYAGEIRPPPPGVDWSEFGSGTEPFKEHFRTALREHADNGLLMDFAFGLGMGHGVPAAPDDEGLQWDLVRHRRGPFNHSLLLANTMPLTPRLHHTQSYLALDGRTSPFPSGARETS